MVLVDTSVWVRAFMGVSPYAARLDRLLELKDVAGHALVYGELFIGDLGARKRQLSSYVLMQQAIVVPHNDVVEFVTARRLHGRGLSWIDAHLLASAIVSRLLLWAADKTLAVAASEIGIAYEPLRILH